MGTSIKIPLVFAIHCMSNIVWTTLVSFCGSVTWQSAQRVASHFNGHPIKRSRRNKLCKQAHMLTRVRKPSKCSAGSRNFCMSPDFVDCRSQLQHFHKRAFLSWVMMLLLCTASPSFSRRLLFHLMGYIINLSTWNIWGCSLSLGAQGKFKSVRWLRCAQPS